MSDLNVYTTSQINALTPITGDLVVDSTINAVKLYDGAVWKTFNSSVVYQNRWAASFDGVDDDLSFGSNTLFNSSSAFSVSAWVDLDAYSPDTFPTICVLKTDQSTGWMLGLSNHPVSYTGVWLGSSANFAGLATVDASLATSLLTGWHHIVATFDGVSRTTASSFKLYVDGVSKTLYASGGYSATPNTNQIGFGNGNNTRFNGQIDEFAIFNSELSSSDVTAIYNSGTPTDLTLAGSYDTDRTSNLKGYWRMGDHSSDSATSGGSIATITDSSGNGNNATQATASSQPTFKALDQSTTSISLDGTDDYVSVPDADNLSFGNGSSDSPFTLALWLNSDTSGSLKMIAKGQGVPQEYAFAAGSAGTPNLTLYDGDVTKRIQITSQTALTQGTWQHWAVTYDGSGSHSNSKIYLNGNPVSTTTASSGVYVAMNNTSTPLDIGYHNITVGSTTYETFTNGHLDDVAVFNTALSASDVASLAASRGAHIINDLSLSPVAYYRMGEDDNLTNGQTGISQITDASGNGNHATQATAANQPTASVSSVTYV